MDLQNNILIYILLLNGNQKKSLLTLSEESFKCIDKDFSRFMNSFIENMIFFQNTVAIKEILKQANNFLLYTSIVQ